MLVTLILMNVIVVRETTIVGPIVTLALLHAHLAGAAMLISAMLVELVLMPLTENIVSHVILLAPLVLERTATNAKLVMEAIIT